MNGTEWTEPGQGATLDQLGAAITNSPGSMPENRIKSAWRRLDQIGGGSFRNNRDHCTNLRLTGAPLTADDLDRIAKCK